MDDSPKTSDFPGPREVPTILYTFSKSREWSLRDFVILVNDNSSFNTETC